MTIEIPTIDLEGLGLFEKEEEIDPSIFIRVAKEIYAALSTVGFFYLKNHGVPQSKIDEAVESTGAFFKLPLADKNTIHLVDDGNFQGYIGQQVEVLPGSRSDLREIRETFNCNSFDGQFPDNLIPEFRTTVCCLVGLLTKLSNRLLKCLALSLNVQEDFFLDRHKFIFKGPDKCLSTFRTAFYPSLTDSDMDNIYEGGKNITDGLIRCAEHTDYGTFTLLLQDNMGGLELMSGDEWVPAKPIPGTIVVIVGDLLALWTSNRYKATIHRVLVPEDEIKRRSPRRSLAFFLQPDNEVIISPLDGSVDDERFQPIGSLEYIKTKTPTLYKFNK